MSDPNWPHKDIYTYQIYAPWLLTLEWRYRCTLDFIYHVYILIHKLKANVKTFYTYRFADQEDIKANGNILTVGNGMIQTPGWPQNYNNDEFYTRHIQAQPDMVSKTSINIYM